MSMATCRRPSAGETPRQMTLWESLTLSRCGSVIACQAPPGRARRAIRTSRVAVYQAAYWCPACVTMPLSWNDSTLTSPS
nr:hypothetical protein [Nonomuraea sp. SYSU D8015]